MQAQDIRAYAKRDWARASRAKLERWKRQYHAHGPALALRAGDALRAHVLAFARSTVDAERRRDFANLVQLKQRIDAVRTRFAGQGSR